MGINFLRKVFRSRVSKVLIMLIIATLVVIGFYHKPIIAIMMLIFFIFGWLVVKGGKPELEGHD